MPETPKNNNVISNVPANFTYLPKHCTDSRVDTHLWVVVCRSQMKTTKFEKDPYVSKAAAHNSKADLSNK